MNELGIPDHCRGCEIVFEDFEELKKLINDRMFIIASRPRLLKQIESDSLDLYLDELNTKIFDVESRIESKQIDTVGCLGTIIDQVLIDGEYTSLINCQRPFPKTDKPS